MKKHFLSGLVILLPLMIALWALFSLIGWLTEPFVGIVSTLLEHLSIVKSPQFTFYLSQFLILVFLFFITVFLGAIARTFFFHPLLNLGDFLLKKIPVFNTVYKTTREIIETLFGPNTNAFKQVVLVPFPHEKSYTLGIVAKEAPKMLTEHTQEKMLSVFIPTTPNPTTGFILLFKEKEVTYVPISTEDALKFVLSCGVITPKKEKTS